MSNLLLVVQSTVFTVFIVVGILIVLAAIKSLLIKKYNMLVIIPIMSVVFAILIVRDANKNESGYTDKFLNL